MVFCRGTGAILLFLLGIVSSSRAWAVNGLPFDPSLFSNPLSLLSSDTVLSIVRTVGIAADHRPYQPATPLGTLPGIDFGVEATVVKLPPDFINTLQAAGLNTKAVNVVPVPKLHLHKGLGKVVDIGASAVSFHGLRIWGGDVKITFLQPEEAPDVAIRFCYSNASIGFVKTQTYTPEILFSRELDFADPYIGAGYEYVRGAIELNLPPPIGMSFTRSASGGAAIAFGGVAIRMPIIGFKITIEGSYNSVGADTLGTKIGFSF